MDKLRTTLEKAYALIDNYPQPLSPESTCIRCFFVSPAQIRQFGDETLYLAFIDNLLKERFNVAFPEEPAAFSRYLSDCIALKDQLQADGRFERAHWLACTVRLLEALKTPYYAVYSKALLTFSACFSERELFEQTLQAFYSVIIKSDKRKLRILSDIIENAPAYRRFSILSETLLAGILENHLALFASEKEYWLTPLCAQIAPKTAEKNANKNPARDPQREARTLLRRFTETEKTFLGTLTEPPTSLAAYLAAYSLWLSEPASLAAHSTEDAIHAAHAERGFLEENAPNSEVDSEFLNIFAYNMNLRNYVTNPAIGREQELADLELILISPKKSPILVGEAGVGKTSVVEGLAYRLARGEVPKLLKDKKLFKLTTTSLLSGTKYVGEMEDRIKKLAGELAAHPDVILFIDEIHTIVGAGSTESSNNDISNMLKPYIDRGDIKIIGATTREEYERFLLPDRALARRFYPIAIEEPTEAMTLAILQGTIPAIEHDTQVRNAFSEEETEHILQSLIAVSRPENQPTYQQTRLPELPLSLLEMAFSYAALHEEETLSARHVVAAVRHSSRLIKEARENFSLKLE